MRYIILLSILSLLSLTAPGTALAIYVEDSSGQVQKPPPPPPPPPGPISPEKGGPPAQPVTEQGTVEGTATESATRAQGQGTTTATQSGTTTGTMSTGSADVDVDTGSRASGAVDVDVNRTTDADTDAFGMNETGETATGQYSGDTGSLPSTDFAPNRTRITCGEVREINYEYYILSLGRRFGTRHYVVTPATMFSPPDFSFEMIEVGSRVMISYVTVHGIRIAVSITVHE